MLPVFLVAPFLAIGYIHPFRCGLSDRFLEREVESGVAYRLEARWREVSVSRRTYVQPHLTVFDSAGKTLLSREIGMVQQRVHLPTNQSVQVWQVVAIPGEDGQKSVSPAGFEGVATVKMPPGAAKLRLSVVMYGEKGEIADTVFSAEPAEVPKPHKCSFPPLGKVKEISDGELDAALAARRKCTARTVRDGSRTVVEINGERRPFRIYKNCRWDIPHRYRVAKVFADRGFDVFTYGVTLSDVWKADGTVDASPFRTVLRKALKCNPEALLMVELGIRPRAGWGAENPDEVFRCEDGRYGLFAHGRVCAFVDKPEDDPKRKAFAVPSYLSGKFAAETSAAIGEFFRQVEMWPESKALVGVYMNGGTDGQWLDLFDNSALPRRESADYSAASQRTFDRYRLAKGEKPVPVPPNSSFRRTGAADFGEHASTPESEWRECYANGVSEMRLLFARTVKEATGGRLLVGSYSPQTGLAGSVLTSQTAAWKLIDSPCFDFFAVVPSYLREPCDPVISAVFNASLVRHGKLYVSELDLRSGDVGHWGFWGSKLWKDTHTAQTFRNKVLHYVCHAISSGGTYHAFDMDGGWFNTPAAQETWAIANAVAKEARSEVPTDDRIAVVLGERFFDHRSQGFGHMLAYAMREMPRHALAISGVPHGYYLVDDMLADPSASMPKVVMFADASTVTYDQYRELRRRYARAGRVLVWFWRPGAYAKDGARIDADLAMRAHPEADGRWIVAPDRPKDPLMKGVSGMFTAWYPYYADGIVFPPAHSPDGWATLACFSGTDVPGVSVRRSSACTEVHVANPGQITAEFIRNLAMEAGVRPLVDSNEICGYGSGLFYILAQTAGKKCFRLPENSAPDRVLAGPPFREEGGMYAVNMALGEVFVLQTAAR